jgi:hypothetical protein
VEYCTPITVTHSTDIASGRSVVVEFQLPIDLATDIETTLYLVATADSLDEVEEAIETNNTLELSRTVALERRASLTAQPFAPGIHRDETNLVTLGVRNDGDKTAPAGFELTLDVYEDASYTIPFCAQIAITCPVDVLPGQTVWVDFPLPVDISVPVDTWLYLVATIDSLDEVEEFDETDNVAEVSVQVLPERMPDLIVEDIGLPAHMRRGVAYDVTVTVRNDDNEAVTALFSVGIAEPSASWSYTWQVDTDLAPGAQVVLSATYSVPASAAVGDRTFTATADTTAAVVERDEGNNSLTETSPIATLDLQIQLTAAPSLPVYAGAPFTFSFRVTNAGSVRTPATQVSAYRCYVTDFDTYLQTWSPVSVPSLAPGGTVDFDRTLTSTASFAWGTCIGFEVDPDDVIAEDDETNNLAGVAYVW